MHGIYRRKTIYFLYAIKCHVPPILWSWLQYQCPEGFVTPFDMLHIAWNEIDQTSQMCHYIEKRQCWQFDTKTALSKLQWQMTCVSPSTMQRWSTRENPAEEIASCTNNSNHGSDCHDNLPIDCEWKASSLVISVAAFFVGYLCSIVLS
jgi:hypothetical protein